jgi:hypothetical protein
VVQEAVLPRLLVAQCGHAEIAWDMVEKAYRRPDQNCPVPAVFLRRSLKPERIAILETYHRTSLIDVVKAKDMTDMFFRTSRLQCADARDRVFASLPL